MRSTELSENLNSLSSAVDDWVSGDGKVTKITSNPDHTHYQNASGEEMYRVWSLSLERVRKLIVLEKTLQLKAKNKALSFSWSPEGAKAVTKQGYEAEGILVYVKKEVQPESIIFNVYDFATQNPAADEDGTMRREQEVLVQPTDYYLSINKTEILNYHDLVEAVIEEWPGYAKRIKQQNNLK